MCGVLCPKQGVHDTDSNDRRHSALCFKTSCVKIGGIKISLVIEKKMLKALRTKLIILYVSEKIKALVILNLILSIKDSLDDPEVVQSIFRDVEGIFWKGASRVSEA